MPLHGKIVVIKRSGGDGTEFPLTATCLFGRKPDCDIRIQLPQVSKEHCRIDLNENKEVILTNLSAVNPTQVNGEPLHQSERLKHGDVITIIDRSFRFEYPPAPTPKKRSSVGGKTETFKVLQDQQVVDTVITEASEKRISETSTDPHLKDGANHDNILRSMEKTVEVESKEDDCLQQNKTTSPFNDLYQMIKKSLDVKTPRKSSVSLLQTPSSRFCTPKPSSVRKNSVLSTEDKSIPEKDQAKVSSGADETKGGAENIGNGTPKSVKKQRKSFQVPSEVAKLEAENAVTSVATSPLKRNRATPQRFTVCEVIEQVSAQTPKSPMRRRSKETTPAKPAVTSPKTEHLRKPSPRNSGKVETVTAVPRKRKSGELAADLPLPQMKKKRVSFGGHLSPEVFDKRLPPDSPLRKGATPRRSLSLFKPKQSLLRRASVIGLLQEYPDQNVQSPTKMSPSPKKSSAKNPSPKTPSPGKKSQKSSASSPKAATPAKKSPKSSASSPKAATPAKKSPKSSASSPKAATPAKKSPKSSASSPKAATPAKKSPKSSTSSPKAATPAKKSTKSSASSPKTATPGAQSSKSKSPSPAKGRSPSRIKVETPGVQTPTVQGRFSVSRISTPSPVAEDTVTAQVPSVSVTPKIPLRRKSMKSTSRKTQSTTKSAVKLMCRKSGISRASLKALKSFADTVKFGQTKAQVAAPAKKPVLIKTKKKAVPKPQTPARKLKDYVSTGHANSPVTIVVGRAHKQKVEHPTGAAPQLVTNMAVLKRNMKMDEDLTGISEMYKTPISERQKRSVISEDCAIKSSVGSLGTSMMEPSVLNTPEEPGEMVVSPLSVSSIVKARSYSSEAVQRLFNGDQESSFISDMPASETHSDSSEQQSNDLTVTTSTTPKQKPELPDCLTGVRRIMKTPRQQAEPVEDLRGRLLKTPKQKIEQQECLTGVKRIMKTPRQKAEPVEDLRGKILKTPKQKPEQQECLTGVKRIFKTPQQDADLQGKLVQAPKTLEAGDVKEITETPAHMLVSEDVPEMTGMKTPNLKRSPLVCLTGIKRIMKTPREKGAPVEDMVGVKRLMKTPREKIEPVEDNFGIKRLMKSPRLRGNGPVEDFEGLKELMEEPVPAAQLEMSVVQDHTPPGCGLEVAKADASEIITDDHSEQVSKVVESKPSEDKQEVTERSEDPVVPAPVRGRRGKKTEAAAPPAVSQTRRGRNAKNTESKDVELTMEKTASLPAKVAPKLKRGRSAKQASDDQAERVQEVATEMMPEPQSEKNSPVDVDDKANNSTAPLEKAVLKPKRGRKTKQSEKPVPEQSDMPCPQGDDLPQADMAKETDANKVCSNQLEVVPNGGDENKSSDTMETVPQAPAVETLQVERATSEETEMEVAVAPKKSVRGRRVKAVESKKAAEDKQEVTEHSEASVAAAPVRGRRGKKTEAAAPPAVSQTRRGRNAKSQESTSDDQPDMVPEKAVETAPANELTTEAAGDQTSPVNAHQEENDSAPTTEEVVVKSIRGRKTKTPAQPPQPEQEKKEVVSEEHLMTDAQPQKSIPAVGKPRRGRKTKADAVEQHEDSVVTVEIKQQSQPPVRAKRGRNAKQEEEKPESNVEPAKSQEPVKKLRRTRKAEQDRVEEVQTIEMAVQEEAEAPLVAEPVKMSEQAVSAAKPRRGGRKAKQDSESETLVESTEVQEVPVVSSTDKPKRGRRGTQVSDNVEVTAAAPEQKPDHKLDAEEKNNAELEAPVIKSSRARGAKNEVPVTMPAKRARRGAAPPAVETTAESTVLVSESASSSVAPARRGRRAAAKPATVGTVTSDQTNPTEDSGSAVEEDEQMSKRSVQWKTDVEVFEIPKVTPIKAVRGRKSKLGDQVETESRSVSMDANKTEEKDLSDEAAGAQPAKRARRGAKIADEPATKLNSAEAETQPKSRRGRSAKK
uniref:proliferation marker protein Ki-67 isoform X3 n=1 Tax=Scatophagus argus TaxID=75038 RepID=UPI001ED7F8B9|nr:proliferation marker protein Ki-67 isoform X3 [Scatophagus argus]